MDALLITTDLHVYGGLCYHIYWFSGALDTEHGFQISHQVVVRQTIKSHCEKITSPLV